MSRRQLFSPELLDLADRALARGGLAAADADRFLDLATSSFALSTEPVDRSWYAELEAVSAVAADIGGVTSTHINHLTPRVLDIDDLYVSMQARGIAMIDEIQGPPAWEGPDVLLRQTSFRALAERRTFRDADGALTEGTLRVRFGEVEARGVALTAAGRARFDELVAEVDRRLADDPALARADVAPEVWRQGLPATEEALWREAWAASASGSTTRSRPVGRRRTSERRWSRVSPRDLVGRVRCTWSRSSTRTSCRVPRPGSSPRTSPTPGPVAR